MKDFFETFGLIFIILFSIILISIGVCLVSDFPIEFKPILGTSVIFLGLSIVGALMMEVFS